MLALFSLGPQEPTMTRPSRVLPALAGAAALTIAGMTPAAAAQWTHADPAGDVVSYKYDYKTDTETGPTAEPDNVTSDITQFKVSHTSRRVMLTTTLRDITAASGLMFYEIRAGKRTYSALQRLGTDRELPAFHLSRRDRTVRCSGVRRSVDRTTEKATVSIPRGCLDRPRWVRVGAGALEFTSGRTTETVFADDGLLAAGINDTLTLSPRVKRG
jgi:hypothetical protein